MKTNLVTKWIIRCYNMDDDHKCFWFTKIKGDVNMSEIKSKTDEDILDTKLMEKLLSNGDYYDFLKKGILSSYRAFSIKEDEEDELLKVKEAGNPIDVLNKIKQAIETGTLKLNDEQKNNYCFLLDNASINRFIEDYKDKTFTMNIKESSVTIPCKYFIDFLSLLNKDYDDFFSGEIKGLKEYEKKDFLYLFMNFIRKELLFRRYVFQGEYESRIKEITNCERLDVEYLYYDNPNAVRYKNLDDIKITDELRKEVTSEIPNHLDKLEKAIYIYIKLCKTLSYDPEFYALGQGILAVDKHRNINNIEFVTPDNNEVVCYEFCAIYAKLIKELGFDYEIDGDPLAMLLGNHQSLKTLLGKYFVSVDSVTSVLYGDMTRAKLNQPLEGIKCLNKSQKSKKEFELKLIKVYSLIVNNEKNKIKDYTKLTFDDLFKQNGLDPNKSIFEDKIMILIKEANKPALKTVDLMGYIRKLVKALFESSEKDNNVKFSVINDKERVKEGQKATVSGVFTIIDGEKTSYLLYNDNEKLLIPITKIDLNNMFTEGKLNYIDKQSTMIPGIDVEGFTSIK